VSAHAGRILERLERAPAVAERLQVRGATDVGERLLHETDRVGADLLAELCLTAAANRR
jgi:hypothetical protein